MNAQMRQLAVLLALNVEALSFAFLGYLAGEWLNANWTTSFNWLVLTMLLALVFVAWTWMAVLRKILREDTK